MSGEGKGGAPGRALARIAALGTTHGQPQGLRSRVRLSNLVSLLVMLFSLAGVALNAAPPDRPVAVGSAMLLVVSISVLMLNALGRTTLSRLALALVPPWLLVVPPVLAGYVGSGNYLVIPYALLTMSLLPLLLFRRRYERGLWLAGIIVTGVAIGTHDALLIGVLDEQARRLIAPSVANVKLAQLIVWILIVASAMFLDEDR